MAASSIAYHDFGGFEFRYHYGGNGDGYLIVRGGASFEVTDTDPLCVGLPILRDQQRADATDASLARRTAAALNEWPHWSHDRLAEHPKSRGNGAAQINFVITKWTGRKPALEPFRERWEMERVSLPDEEVVRGLVEEMGFLVRNIDDSGPEADLRGRLEAVRDLLDGG